MLINVMLINKKHVVSLTRLFHLEKRSRFKKRKNNTFRVKFYEKLNRCDFEISVNEILRNLESLFF